MQVELEPYEAILLAGALRDSYRKHVDHYTEKGVLGAMADATEHHLDAIVSAHEKMLVGLRASGYPMTNKDLQAADHKEIVAKPWIG